MILRILPALLLASAAFAQELTLERIMSDPEWMGNGPARPYWADDSDSIHYSREVTGEDYSDLHVMRRDGSRDRVVADEDLGAVSVPGGDISRDGKTKVYEREGDLYVKSMGGGRIRQLTRTTEREREPSFLKGEGRIVFERGDTLFVRDLESGLESQPLDLRTEDDPEKKEEKDDFLTAQQERLFDTIRESKRQEELNKARAKGLRAADDSTVPSPWYLGKNTKVVRQALSPDEAWLALVTVDSSKEKKAKRDALPSFVTESGYTTTRDLRARVGTESEPGEQLLLLDLRSHEQHAIPLDSLPGITDDAFAFLKTGEGDDEAPKDGDDVKKDDAPQARPLQIAQLLWTGRGDRLLAHCFSHDRKDRWIAEVDLAAKALRPLYRETDPAWINRRFARLDWLDDRSFFFLSEETGYSHLYRMALGDELPTALTSGAFEVSGPQPTRDGDWIYYLANRTHPGVYEAHRVNTRTGASDAITNLGGGNAFTLSPDERYVLVEHSTATMPPELYVQRARPGANATRVTHTVSDAFLSIDWTAPEVVAIPSTHGAAPIYSRVYTPKESASAPRPAVVFVHGAGYLQNADLGWSSYFREFMFHSLLVSKGYVVLDMDYRASAGYGRDWRTAIYRQMGTPELEDLEDGVAWLAANRNVDAARVGVYGGSYGGFLTLMALFTKPDLFACGAALRPVTDWSSYNHGYTGNILNTPAIDPEAFNASSPIEFAEGLTKPLLICHGMQDDNVFYQDSVRLAQRLIELKKTDWELASYPVESHGFKEPTSWLDEYGRILKLFETHLSR